MATPRLYQQIKNDLKGFGDNPVVDVGRILTLVQGLKVPEKEAMRAVQEIYVAHYQAVKGVDANKARQSWVTASGNSFETYMRNLINHALNAEGILAMKGDRLRQKPSAENIVNFLTLKANRRCTQTTTGVWPDSDIVVLTRETSGTVKAYKRPQPKRCGIVLGAGAQRQQHQVLSVDSRPG